MYLFIYIISIGKEKGKEKGKGSVAIFSREVTYQGDWARNPAKLNTGQGNVPRRLGQKSREAEYGPGMTTARRLG